jgi:coenzyme F420-reducing hydrogenase delta subunit
MVSYDVREIRNSLSTVVGAVDPTRQEPVIAAFMCTHHAGVLGFNLPKNIHSVPVHCTSRIDILDLLKAVEIGVDGVAVVRCNDGTCKYKDIAPRVNARIRRGQEMLDMLGIGSGRIELLSASTTEDGNPYAAACADFSGRIGQMGLRVART